MDLIERVAQVLGKYSAVRFQRNGNSIEVPPASADGFHVSLSTEAGSRIVHYEGWHDEFDNDDDALNCFMLGLTPEVRLRVVRRGDCDHKWSAEVRIGDRWEDSGAVGLLFFPFWRRKEVVTLQNRWIQAPDPESEK